MFHVMCSPSNRQAGAPVINIQSTLPTSPDLCKNVSLAVLFGSNGNCYTTQSSHIMCVYTNVLYIIQTVLGQQKYKNTTQQ